MLPQEHVYSRLTGADIAELAELRELAKHSPFLYFRAFFAMYQIE